MQLLNNRYRFEKLLGRGAIGQVHLCHDVVTNKLVAVKECIPQGDHVEKAIERIRREHYFMSKIHHPNLVHGLDLIELPGRLFIVMEYIEGITLKKLIYDHKYKIHFKQQLEIAKQICVAVAVLNDNGIIHRDLKPANVMLKSDLTPVILDLGIAKSTQNDLDEITRTGALVGTPQYMAPEQINEKIKATKNTDVFALGALLYQFFSWSDHSPFYDGHVSATMKRVVQFSPPTIVVPDEFDYVAAVVDKALQKDPAQRFSSASEMVRMLSSPNAFLQKQKNIQRRAKKRKKKKSVARQVVTAIFFCSLLIGGKFLFFNETNISNKVRETEKVVKNSETQDPATPVENNQTQNPATSVENNQTQDPATSVGSDKIENAKNDANNDYSEICEQHYKKGIAYFDARKYEIAMVEFNAIIELQPAYKEYIAYQWRGYLYHIQGKYDLAMDDYDEFVKMRPEYWEGYARRAYVHAHRKQYDLCVKEYDKAIQYNPKRAKLYHNRAAAYTQIKKDNLALADYNKAIELEPRNRAYLASRAYLYEIHGKNDLAIADYSTIIEITPNYIEARQKRVKLCYHQGNVDMIISDCTYIMNNSRKQVPNTYWYRGTAYSRKKQYPLAIADFNKALRLDGNHYWSYHSRGRAYHYQGNLEQALADYNRSLRIKPNNIDVYVDRGRLYERLGKHRLAAQNYNTIIRLAPKSVSGYEEMGGLFSRLKKYKKAIAYWKKCIALGAKDKKYLLLIKSAQKKLDNKN
ncbi:serine/threonine-protein kinase [Candidatus Uabimicrobium amorphum]|uniref:Protein kinase domain-containing protein n=1 Tax=Uabimicrobium amorphum TaxID=2596890 RepID=A0A5S9IR03_UABAM|nr:serine/threonine-protein kinase [Candidatus Uabimicrobium amorphum]BBM86508.1 hypothetical protein UABAM_04894 [Candidatus Uabimicrobium amorphum]